MRITPLIHGERVLLRRRAKKLSQAQCAQAAGVSARTIHRIERNQSYATPAATLGRLALALGTSADYLLGLTDDPAPKFRRQGGRHHE
jgi:transcriptional regulator with XRE-family HTH domain